MAHAGSAASMTFAMDIPRNRLLWPWRPWPKSALTSGPSGT